MEQDLEGAGRKKLPCALGRCPSWSFLEGKTGNYFKMANVQYTLLQKLHFWVCVPQQAESQKRTEGHDKSALRACLEQHTDWKPPKCLPMETLNKMEPRADVSETVVYVL